MSRRTRSFFFDNKNGKLFTGISFTLKDIEDEVEGVSDIDGTKVSDFARSAIQTSIEPFLDSDTVIMTAAATDDRIQVVTNSIIDSAPGALDTLNELAAALGDDANFSTTVTNSIATKANSADLATVATTGAYADLTGKPTIPAVLTDLSITDGTNGQVLTTNGSGTFTFADASGGISNVVEDTTPELGGDLDVNNFKITSGNVLLNSDYANVYGETLLIESGYGTNNGFGGWGVGGNISIASPVGQGFNGKRGNISTTSDIITFNSSLAEFKNITSAYAASIRLYEASVNGSNSIRFNAPTSIASNVEFTLPSSDGTNGQVLTTNGSGTLAWSTPDGVTTGKAIAMAMIFGG